MNLAAAVIGALCLVVLILLIVSVVSMALGIDPRDWWAHNDD